MSEQHRNSVAAVLRELADRVETEGLAGYTYDTSAPSAENRGRRVTVSLIFPEKS